MLRYGGPVSDSRARLRTWLPRLVLVLAGGLLLSLVAFNATSPRSRSLRTFTSTDSAVCIVDIASAGFDPWTGQPHGDSYDTSRCPDGTGRVVFAVPSDLQGHQAIPIPVGFVLGCAFSAGSLYVRGRRTTPSVELAT